MHRFRSGPWLNYCKTFPPDLQLSSRSSWYLKLFIILSTPQFQVKNTHSLMLPPLYFSIVMVLFWWCRYCKSSSDQRIFSYVLLVSLKTICPIPQTLSVVDDLEEGETPAMMFCTTLQCFWPCGSLIMQFPYHTVMQPVCMVSYQRQIQPLTSLPTSVSVWCDLWWCFLPALHQHRPCIWGCVCPLYCLLKSTIISLVFADIKRQESCILRECRRTQWCLQTYLSC